MLRKAKTSGGAPNPYAGLRARALAAVEEGLAPPGPDHPNVWGVVVDLSTKDRTGYTIVALGDGTTNLHLSGGRTVTASDDEASVRAAEVLLTTIEREALDQLAPESGKLPRPDQARYHVLHPDGLRGMDVPRDQVWGEKEGGGPVVAATQDLLRALRRLSVEEPGS